MGKAYERILVLNAEIYHLQEEINSLKLVAIKELYEMGNTLDGISKMLRLGKATVLRIIHSENIKKGVA